MKVPQTPRFEGRRVTLFFAVLYYTSIKLQSRSVSSRSQPHNVLHKVVSTAGLAALNPAPANS